MTSQGRRVAHLGIPIGPGGSFLKKEVGGVIKVRRTPTQLHHCGTEAKAGTLRKKAEPRRKA